KQDGSAACGAILSPMPGCHAGASPGGPPDRGRWMALGLLHRLDADRVVLADTLDRELHATVHQREQRVVLADADVDAGVEPRAALAHDDRPGGHDLATERLHAQHLGFGIAAVTGRAAALLLCHCLLLLFGWFGYAAD